jgi:hypothetical protein
MFPVFRRLAVHRQSPPHEACHRDVGEAGRVGASRMVCTHHLRYLTCAVDDPVGLYGEPHCTITAGWQPERQSKSLHAFRLITSHVLC